jgi:copper chaperone CopZ
MVLIAVLLAATLLAGCASKTQVSTEAGFPDHEIRVYEVFGMDCPGCHGGLEKLVNAIPGVAGSKAAWQKKSLTVYIPKDGKVDDADVLDAIKRANFTAGKRIQ